MRTVLVLLAALLAIKTAAVTTASGQEACTKKYTGCLDRCVTRPSKALQDNCMEACQTQTTACFSEVYGGAGPNAQTVREEPAKPENAAADQAEAPAAKTGKPAKAAAKTGKPERKPQ